MTSDYALNRSHGQETVIIHAADLYLLDQWRINSATSDDAQRSAIFSKWLEIGVIGRLPYVERLKEMEINDDDISEDEKNLLAQVRSPSDRQEISYTRVVRTYYGDGSDENFAKLIFEAEYSEAVFNDAALYDAGSEDGLHSVHNILTHIPQIVEQTPKFAVFYLESKRQTRDDLDDYADHLSAIQLASKWTHVLIYDKKANDGPGSLLLVYIDDRGRILRYCRLEDAEDWSNADGLLLSGQDDTRRWWEESRYGEDWEPNQIFKRLEEFDHDIAALEA